MKIGTTEITRDMMPSQISWQQANPEYHLFETCQDILNAKLAQGIMPVQPTQQGQMEQQSNSWNQ